LLLFAQLDRWFSPAPAPAKVSWLGQWAFAHRGLHGPGVPENSPSAFDAAVARGMGIECDIQRSGDGHAMVFHDAELDRLTGEQGLVSSRSTEELGKIRLSGSDDCIPTLRQMLDRVAGRVPLLIEIKSPKDSHGRLSALCLSVRRVLEGYQGPHAIMSFDPRIVRWFAEHSPLTVRGLVVTEENDKALPGMVRRRLALWHAKPHFLAYDIRDLPSRFAARQRQRGLPVVTWTVRSAEHQTRAAAHADAPIAEGAGTG
jgi:glycerophosphoryl diester phosphodiesterase